MGFDAKDWIRGNPKIKSANSSEYIEGSTLIERLNEMKKILEDPIYFAEKYFYIVTLDNGKQLIKIYPKQAELIKAMCSKLRVVALASRQSRLEKARHTRYSCYGTASQTRTRMC